MNNRDRYFETVEDLIQYASDDIERFNDFEFKYGAIGNQSYNIARRADGLKKIDSDTFEFNGMTFDLNMAEPCC